jgi:hypothetical protein
MAEDRGAFKTNSSRLPPVSAFVIFFNTLQGSLTLQKNRSPARRAALFSPLFAPPQKDACDILDRA